MKKLGLLFGIAALGGGCSVDHNTQITVAIASEAEIPTELDTFSVTVTTTRTNEVRFSQEYNPSDGSGFPTTLAVIPADEDSLGSPIQIAIEGRKGDQVLLSRTSVVSYIEGRNLMLAMPLRMACFEQTDCASGKTCEGGQCVAPTVSSASLPDFSETLLSKTAPDCFDENKCLANKTLVDVASDCTFPITGDPKQLNVAIRWAAAPLRILTLDSGDAQEGWTTGDASHGKLSEGICDSHFQKTDANGKPLVKDVAQQVYVTTGCAAKTSLTPYCGGTGQQVGVGASSTD